jgi:MinD superfamily P-loop ATPase
MMLAIASGKGGTGKTTLAVNIALSLTSPVQLLDCDVEEPNAHLFLNATPLQQEVVTIPVPEIDPTRCKACGECSRFCQYNAVAALPTGPLVFPELCHGCGGCGRVCPNNAIRERGQRIGVVEILEAGHVTLIQGRLDVGVAMAPPLIRAVRARQQQGVPVILDSPPGTSCPVIAALCGAQAVILVTEPTPFGLHDLTLAVAMVRALHLPFGVVVNRAGVGDERVQRFCQAEGIPLLLEIPDDRRIAEAYSCGTPVVRALPEYRRLFLCLYERARALTVDYLPQTRVSSHAIRAAQAT